MRTKVRIGTRVHIGRKAIPTWLLVTALVVVGAGAAVGTLLAGMVTGEVAVRVSQALLVDKPWVTDTTKYAYQYYIDGAPHTIYRKSDDVTLVITAKPERYIETVSDDHTAFQVAAEIGTGDAFMFALPLKNATAHDLVAELEFAFPEGLSLEVYAPSVASKVPSLVRTGLYTWRLKITAGADYKSTDIIKVVVAASDTILPGFYAIDGTVTQVEY